MLSKTKKKKTEPKKQSKSDANFQARQFGGKVEGFGGIENVHFTSFVIQQEYNERTIKKIIQRGSKCTYGRTQVW